VRGPLGKEETIMDKNTTKAIRLKVRTHIKAGGIFLPNHNQTVAKASGLKVRTSIRAGAGGDGKIGLNHNETVGKASRLKVRTSIKAGGIYLPNHNEAVARASRLEARTSMKAGASGDGKLGANHNETVVR
jgi:hypothetical protein